MSEWSVVRIADLGTVTTGRTPPSSRPKCFGHLIPFITPTDMTGSRTVEKSQRFLSEEEVELLQKCVVENGVAVSCIGWQMGKALLIKEPSVTNQQINTIVPETNAVDLLYLYYALSARRDEIFRLGSGGSRTPILNKSAFSQLEVALPPLEMQRRIAHILGTLDDKIELNRKMNRTLEVIARAIFKSWSVDFDPVIDNALAAGKPIPEEFAERAARRARLTHGKSPLPENIHRLFPDEFQDSELGPIPKGWEVGVLQDLAEVQIGGDWGKEVSFDGGIAIRCLRGVDLGHLRETGTADAPLRWIKKSSFEKRNMDSRDVLIATSGAGPLGRVLWVSPGLAGVFPEAILYSNFCKRLRAESEAWAIYMDAILAEMRASGEIWEFSTGTSVPNLDVTGLMESRDVLIPPQDILERYASYCRVAASVRHSPETEQLRQIRDTLLPWLLSGGWREAAIK